jgi:uncharacterized protein (TIGR02118 family)
LVVELYWGRPHVIWSRGILYPKVKPDSWRLSRHAKKLIVLYPPPSDAASFERFYHAEHAPMVRKIPGLKKFVAAKVVGTPSEKAPYQRVAELYFDSVETLHPRWAHPLVKTAVAHAMEFRPVDRR